MKSIATLLLLTILLTPITDARSQNQITGLEKTIPQLMKKGDVPGLSIALIRNHRIVWSRGFGVKNAATKEPVDEGTVFEAASLSKPLFAYAVLQLVDQGKIDLDRPLSNYLPGPYLPDERVNLITARMVLDHTTGFQNEVTPGRPLKIYFTPGEKFSYSGEGFQYLQKVVEQITGKPLDLFIKQTVFEPLGMTSSSFVWQPQYETAKANGHRASGAAGELRKPSVPRAASTLHTTARDYARFVIAIMSGRGLRQATAKQFFTAQVRLDESCYSCIEKSPGKLSPALSWGLGWGVERSSRGEAIWHWGENNGEYQNFVMAYPRQQTAIIILTNSGNGLSIIPAIVAQALGGGHPAFAWMGYELYNSPRKLFFRDILARGETAIDEYRQTRNSSAGRRLNNSPGRLNENQMNGVGYWLLGKNRVKEAIEIFKLNVADYPNSANVYDSLGEAYMIAGNKSEAIKNYQRSLALDPNNDNARQMIKKLEQQ